MSAVPLLLLAGPGSAKRRDLLAGHLTTDWRIETVVPAEDPTRLAEIAPQATAIVGGPLPKPWPRLDRLKLYHVPYTGLDELDVEMLPPGVILCNTFEHESTIAEYVLLAMLEWEIRLGDTHRRFREKSWDGIGAANGPVHGEVRGKRLGIIGYGHIGREVARRAAAFDMTVAAVTRTERPAPAPLRWLGGMDRMHDLLRESDYVLVTAPLTPETENLIDDAALAAMPPHGVIINVGRGPVIDQHALYAALKEKRIGGAVIDVWYNYPTKDEPNRPPGDHPFAELDNIIMTPHNSAWTGEMIERRWRFVAGQLDRFARGEELENIALRT